MFVLVFVWVCVFVFVCLCFVVVQNLASAQDAHEHAVSTYDYTSVEMLLSNRTCQLKYGICEIVSQ